MLYSRFNPSRGLYDVYSDASTRPVNADLPVPRVGRSANGIGVPASLAGRTLPSGVTRVGESWHAKGIVVAPAGAVGLGAVSESGAVGLFAALGLLAGGLVIYWLWDPERRRAAGWR
jgi:hypothetical protein